MAVFTRAETYRRLSTLLPANGIEVEYIQSSGRPISLMNEPSSFGNEALDVGFVYPPRPIEGRVIEAFLEIPWINDRDAITLSRNKAAVIARLHRAGIPVPETTLVSNRTNKEALADEFSRFERPVVIKPNSTTRGRGLVKVHDLDSFLGVTDYFSLLHEFPPTADKSFLLQEFLPDARDYRAMVIEGTYVGAVERRLERSGWTHNVHRGGEVSPTQLSEELQSLAERTASVLDIPFLGVDILANGDRAVVTETNARPTIDTISLYEDDFEDRLVEMIRNHAA